jgi:hypothetical protein
VVPLLRADAMGAKKLVRRDLTSAG